MRTNLTGFNLYLIPALMHVGEESLDCIFFSGHHQSADAVSWHLEVFLVRSIYSHKCNVPWVNMCLNVQCECVAAQLSTCNRNLRADELSSRWMRSQRTGWWNSITPLFTHWGVWKCVLCTVCIFVLHWSSSVDPLWGSCSALCVERLPQCEGHSWRLQAATWSRIRCQGDWKGGWPDSDLALPLFPPHPDLKRGLPWSLRLLTRTQGPLKTLHVPLPQPRTHSACVRCPPAVGPGPHTVAMCQTGMVQGACQKTSGVSTSYLLALPADQHRNQRTGALNAKVDGRVRRSDKCALSIPVSAHKDPGGWSWWNDARPTLCTDKSPQWYLHGRSYEVWSSTLRPSCPLAQTGVSLGTLSHTRLRWGRSCWAGSSVWKPGHWVTCCQAEPNSCHRVLDLLSPHLTGAHTTRLNLSGSKTGSSLSLQPENIKAE